MSDLVSRFLEYVKINTRSEEGSEENPSTKVQFDLAEKLAAQLKELGLKDAGVDKHCYVTATLEANMDKKVPVIGFLAHLDTSPDVSGEGVKPKIVENYDGKDIVLNRKENIILSPESFPELKNYIGDTLITSDGTTLLGADDKAGIAEIMTAAEHLVRNPDIKHGTIKIAFTPDEEIGKGTDHFDVKKFGADFAYTLDGGKLGELEFENFNAAKAVITVKGRNIHPGYAKNRMVNSALIAMEYNSMLPVEQTPFYTEKREGFFHLISVAGDVEETKLSYLVRDHDMEKFEAKKELARGIGDFLNQKHGEGRVDVHLEDQYLNMREKLEPVMHIVETAEKAMIDSGIKPIKAPIRGGTDGARLSYMGLPTPNLFAGGHNFHSRFEYVPVRAMEKAVEVVLRIIELYAAR
ncbi:MAG TPA: peptidase T [Candidatus Krumholzibacteriaceae bacterium]|nr:peptidase T [Candidatus Krumholzibacteriaceae bacterium]